MLSLGGSCQIFGAVRFEPRRSFLDSPRERRCSCAVDFWHIVVKPRWRRKTTRTYYRFWKSGWNNELRCIGFGWLRSPISINQESEDNIELLPLNHLPCVTLCTLSLSCQTTLTKRQKKKMSDVHEYECTTKLTQVSSFSESHTRHGRARHQIRDWSESGRCRELLTPGTSDSCRPRGVVTRDFSAIFDRLFDRLPVRISTSDLHHWILRKKIFHIRAYDFGVQFSFKSNHNYSLSAPTKIEELTAGSGEKKHNAALPGIEPRILRILVARSNHWATKPQRELRVNFRLSWKKNCSWQLGESRKFTRSSRCGFLAQWLERATKSWVRFPAGLRCVFSPDPAVSSSIFVGAEREELIRNDPDKSEFTSVFI